MTRPWEAALDAKTDVFKFWHSEDGLRYSRGFLQSIENKLPREDNDLEKALHSDMVNRFADAAARSDPIYIDSNMMTVIEHASKTMKIETLRAEDLICIAGIVLLPRPYTVKDVNDKDVSFRLINWFPIRYNQGQNDGSIAAQYGLQILFYHFTLDKDDYWQEGEREVAPFLFSFSIPWFFDIGDKGWEHSILESKVGRFMQTLWRLMQQRIAIKTKERASAPFRSRATKAKLEDQHVTLVTLRRPAPTRNPDAEHHDVEWTHQWLVSGHWRNQPYADGVYKQIWINPYTKGPEDLPLALPTTKVYTLVR